MTSQHGTKYRLEIKGTFERQVREMCLEPTAETPFVKYSKDENTFMIKGNSVKANIHQFYDLAISSVKSHLNEGRELDVLICFNTINTSTVKVLFDLFKFIRLKKVGGINVNITWCSETSNREMYETGKDFSEIYGLDFNFLTLK